MKYPVPPRNNIAAACDLRERETRAETVLWDALRGRRLAGLKFRRQHRLVRWWLISVALIGA